MKKLHRIFNINLICILFFVFASCTNKGKENKETPFNNQEKNVLKTESKNEEDSICNKNKYIFCEKYVDKEGIKHITVKEKQKKSEIYDAIEEETFSYISTQLLVTIFLNGNKFIKVFDEETSCHGNSAAKIINNSIKITDIDNNGFKEVSFLYDLVCKEDVTPSNMKFIIIEGNKKYKIRGTKQFFDQNQTQKNLGFNIDKSFNDAPKEFLDYATTVWNTNLFDKKIGTLSPKRETNMITHQKEIIKAKEKFILDHNLQ